MLFVCLGNICRSPLAQGVFQLRADACGIPVMLDSAGTSAYHVGQSPDPRAVAVARDWGMDITAQRARQLKPSDFLGFDTIYVMDGSNLEDVRQRAPACSMTDVKLVMSLLSEQGHLRDLNVPDPYYGSQREFQEVVVMLNQAALAWAQRWTESDRLTSD